MFCRHGRSSAGIFREFKSLDRLAPNMTEVVPPTKRTCERCGRVATWDSDSQTWVATVEDGEKKRGKPHCLHEWDISGNYNPLADEDAA